MWLSLTANRFPRLIGEHFPLCTEDLVDSEAALGGGDADRAGDSPGGGLNGDDVRQPHAEGALAAAA